MVSNAVLGRSRVPARHIRVRQLLDPVWHGLVADWSVLFPGAHLLDLTTIFILRSVVFELLGLFQSRVELKLVSIGLQDVFCGNTGAKTTSHAIDSPNISTI